MLPRRCTLARRRGLRAAIATLATLGTAAVVSTASGQTLRRLTGDADVRAKVRQGLPLAFVRRPGVATRRGSSLPAVSRAPVVITLKGGVQRGDLAALQAAGAILASPPVVVGDHVLARVTPSAMAAVSRLERVATLRLDGEPFGTAPPLFETVPEIHGLDAHRSQQPLGVDGRGVTVCNSDSGIDVLHPLFFRADGGYFAWRDVDADGRLSPGVDTVEVDGVDVPLGVLNGRVTSRLDGSALLNSEDTSFQALSDYVYADLNGNGQRDVGAAAGFDDTTPAFGEPIFVLDDVDGNGAVDPGEKLVRLATSKIAAVHSSGEVFRRGQNLIDVPRDEDISHGTGASGIIVGGHPGLGRLVGVAPGADVLMATRTNGDVGLLELAQWCVAEGASVMLHEYAPWQGHFLDGSEPLEQFIDDTSAQGVAHINPAGNLSGSRKSYKRALPAGMTSVIQIRVPSTPMRFFGTTLLWREPNRPVALTLETPSGDTVDVPPGDGLSLHEA
ncbi:MAG: S8 family serine peptidase, partial [Myxococcota bacterium]